MTRRGGGAAKSPLKGFSLRVWEVETSAFRSLPLTADSGPQQPRDRRCGIAGPTSRPQRGEDRTWSRLPSTYGQRLSDMRVLLSEIQPGCANNLSGAVGARGITAP